MSSLPELSEVLHILTPIEDRYFGLGIHLGIKIQQLKGIESNYPSISRRLTETISLWQENSTGECSWSMLAKAVERIGGHDRLAMELRERDVTNDLMEADSKPQMHHPTERDNGGYLSMSDSIPKWHDSRDESGCSSKSDSNQSVDLSGSEAECRCASKTPYSFCAGGCPNPATHRVSVPILQEKSKAASQNGIPLKKRYFKDYDKSTNDTRKSQHSEDTGYSSRSDSTSGDSEIEHFDKVPGCGCDKPCSIYTLCAGGCPNPTSTKVGVVRKQVQGQETEDALLPEEEGEEEDYAENFEKETRQMRVQFAELVSDTCDSLKRRNVATADLILFLQHASPLALKPRIDEMTKATCLAQVLTIVTGQTCSWFDYEMMAVLINRFGDDGDKKRLKQYEANFYRFAEQRLPKGKKHIEVGRGARVGGKQLVVKIDKEWDEVNFSDLKKVRGNLASLFGVHSRDLYLADIREGCIMMTFMITEELAGRLFPSRSCLTSSQTKSLKGELGVISLRCANLSWRATRHMKPKAVPQNSLGWRFKIFDLRVMMTVMLLLTLVLAGFSGLLVRMQPGSLQVNNDRTHTESDVFTLHNFQDNTTLNVSSLGSSGPPIAKSQSSWDRCPAYFPTEVTRQRNIIKYTEGERANHEEEVTTDSSVEQTTPTSLPNTNTMTTSGETTPPPTAPPIASITLRGPRTDSPVTSVSKPSDSQGVALMVVIVFLMIIIVGVVILVTAVIIKRQNNRNEHQQRILETMRRLALRNTSNGKLNLLNFPQRASGKYTNSIPYAVIGNLLPKRHNSYNTTHSNCPQGIKHVQQEEKSGRSKNSPSSTKHSSMNVANTTIYMEEPEVYQLPPKLQPKRKKSTPGLKLSLQKPPAPPPSGCSGTAEDNVIEIVKEDLSKKASSEVTPPPRPPKKSMSSDTGSSAGEQSPLTGRKPGKPSRSSQSKSRGKCCERGMHSDPSLPKEEEPPPLPPRSTVTVTKESIIHTVDIVVPASAVGHKIKSPPNSFKVITVHLTTEKGEGAGSTVPPNYNAVMEMETDKAHHRAANQHLEL